MINEHDIKDMMNDAIEKLSAEERRIGYKEDGDELVLDLQVFLTNYTKQILKHFNLYE